jgi:uncharacterized protein Yka (UPF0111/DUF47 family)
MFGIFKTKEKRLQDRYNKLMSEWHKLSSVNRAASDEKYAEAQAVLEEIEQLNS